MYAVIESGGKQYRVQEGDVVSVEKLGLIEGEKYDFANVLLIAQDDNIRTGKPYIEGAVVKATVLEEGKGPKIYVYKYKAKKGYDKKTGHRQYYTKLKIDGIQG